MNVKRMLLIMIITAVAGYLLIVAYAYVKQGSMLYFPTREIESTPKAIGLGYEDVTLRTHDDVAISAWYIPAANARGAVLFCHGNAGNISHRLDSIRIFNSLGLSVLIFDYRGYGRSGGSPTEQGTYHDAEAAWDHLVTARGVPPAKIVLFGRSLGSAVAAEMALRHQAGVLIIESGFLSVPELGKRFYPYLPVRLIARNRYATVDKVPRITIPKLIIHSPADEIVPFSHGAKLFEAAAGPKAFLEIGGGHNDGFILSAGHYVHGLDRFLSLYLSH